MKIYITSLLFKTILTWFKMVTSIFTFSLTSYLLRHLWNILLSRTTFYFDVTSPLLLIFLSNSHLLLFIMGYITLKLHWHFRIFPFFFDSTHTALHFNVIIRWQVLIFLIKFFNLSIFYSSPKDFLIFSNCFLPFFLLFDLDRLQIVNFVYLLINMHCLFLLNLWINFLLDLLITFCALFLFFFLESVKVNSLSI